MQAGGKIENDESPLCALRRELTEEIGLVLGDEETPHLGRFSASAANEPRGGWVGLHRLAALISGLPVVDHAAARSGWSKYIWSGVRPPSAECGRTAL